MQEQKFIRRLLRDQRAATAIEYGLIVALVCLAIMASLRSVADKNTGLWAQVRTAVTEVMSL
jgi:pilus assembly protein Flp/PilA